MKEISPKELDLKLKNGENISIIDVREKEEVEAGMIPNAKHIPLGEIPERLNEIDKNQTHYMVCRSGNRSGKASSYMEQHGFEVINMSGGMLEWDSDISK